MTTRRKIRILRRAMEVIKIYRRDHWNVIGSDKHTEFFKTQLFMEELIKKLEDENKR